ncbi:MAG: GGDEF domain-containing protein [Spirochaetales bacterium]|nr:GGDEF domain-containing protein [Spirochaetales bacterium]
MESKIRFLNKIKILEECTKDEQKIVGKFFTSSIAKKNDIIFKQGDGGRCLYIVKKGLIASYTYLADGREMDVARYSSGMFFGETALTEALPRTMTCHALSDVELLKLDFIDFYRIVWTYPEIGVKILKAMIRYVILGLRDADKFLTTMALWGEKARFRAITDELTGLYNKRFFEESLELVIIKSKQKKSTFSLIMFDIDDFHTVNENLGMQTGDEILKNVALCIKSVCGENTVIARLGGDEFAILLPDLSITDTLQIAKKFKEVLLQVKLKIGLTSTLINPQITASIGIAEFPDHGETSVVLKEAVDKALYSSKKAGKNKIMCAQSLM